MFPYSDPVGSGLLAANNALDGYRLLVHDFDHGVGQLPNSAYVDRDAFLEIPAGAQTNVDTVDWLAFPLTATAPNDQIDMDRLRWQDEYVEWRVEKDGAGRPIRITFIMEFPEYYQALAQVSVNALVRGIQEVIPGTNPTMEELFGPGFNPITASDKARARRFHDHLTQNPWNNSEKGIFCLKQHLIP